MAYPFNSSVLSEQSRQKPLTELAISRDAVFDEGFAGRMPDVLAFDLDGFAKGAMKHYTGYALPSGDAVVENGNGNFCFIEFKNQRVKNIDANGILRKVFGSLLMVSMTSAQGLTIRELMKRAIFVVVFPEQDYATMFGYALVRSANPEKPLLWGLDRLVDAEMLVDAYTVTDKEFAAMNIRGIEKETRK